jgi:hypothetical protein
VHEEVAEFHDFYRRHGAGKVEFRLSLIQIDRRLERREFAEVSPNRYYLARENIEAELAARGFRGRFDEVIALHAWSNANPERALQAYGGGAVGPDGRFLGDAGYNSIPAMGRDPETIGQVLIHEVLHNLDDMFSRSGMPDSFFNSDEMSRNMPQLLRERPGAFLPLYTDEEMLAYAERERQGREAYPWAMQLVYYAWMLERTPKPAWDQLRYGHMAPRDLAQLRSLYSTIFTSAANDSVYLPVLGGAAGVKMAGVQLLSDRSFTHTDFDGTPIASGSFLAAWVRLRGEEDSVVVPITTSGGGDVGGRALVVRQRVASVVIEPEIVRYVDRPSPAPRPDVLEDRCCGRGPPLAATVRLEDAPDLDRLPPGTHEVTYRASAPGWYVHPARARVVVRRSWQVSSDGPLTVSLGSAVTLNALVRDDRGRADAEVTGEIAGRRVRLRPTGDGRHSVTVEEELPFGLHWARFSARSPDGSTVRDSVRVYVRPAGWIRVPATATRGPDGTVSLEAAVRGRMGSDIRGSALPLTVIVGDAASAFLWDSLRGRYETRLTAGPEVDRLVVTSLVGDLQRRVVRLVPGSVTRSPPLARPGALPPHAAAPRLERPPVVDAVLDDWPATRARGVELTSRSFLLTDPATYHGDRDLSALIRFAWDDSTLYVAGELTDDSVTSGESWDTDRVNLVFDMKDDTSPVTYPSDNPPLNEWQDDDYWVFWRMGGEIVRRFGKVNADPVHGARLATRRTQSGWAFEAAIPREQLAGFLPFVGQVVGLQVFVTDGDGEASATELMWSARWPYTADGIEWRLAELARLLLVDAPGR